jgi:hypothetical protein
MNSAASHQSSNNINDHNGGQSKSSGQQKNRVESHLINNKKTKKAGKPGFNGNFNNNFLNQEKKDGIVMQPEIFFKGREKM